MADKNTVSAIMAGFGQKGGAARARKLDKAERVASARKAARARWSKAKTKKAAKPNKKS